jgi:hypothetical protein
MTNRNNDIEELEELLTELEGQEARIVTPYSEEDDAVTRLMDAPLGDQDWMVQVTALDRRMMATNQVLSELQAGKINGRTLVWRGGMDDWLPVSRIDELAHASAPPVSMPRTSALPVQRPAFTNLAPPPPPPPAQPSQPHWSSPASAPLPPPPIAMSPPIGIAHNGNMSSSVGLPPPPMALTPPPPPPNAGYGAPKSFPVAALPPPAPLPSGNSFGSGNSFSSGNTTRPVAIDFSDVPDNDPPLQSKRWVMALSAVAILAVFVTVYSLSSGGGAEEEGKQATAAEPRAVNALQPASAAPKEKPAASPAPAAPAKAEVAAAAEPATAKASAEAEAEENEERSSERSSAGSSRQNAPARYAMRSEYRRRTRGSSSAAESSRAEEEPAPAPAAIAAPAAPSPAAEEEEAAPSSEPVAAADEVDEPPKSTGKAGNTFNREAAKSALDEAAEQAKNCRPQGGPSGSGRVQVRYEPSGKVSNVAILTSKFDNTTTGSCVRMLFRRAKVPEFAGAPVVVVNKSFEIP